MSVKVLSHKFFTRSAILVARELLGCVLVRRFGKKITRVVITETEAYEGPKDLASHASQGKTPRNAVMFGKPAVWYVYFVYGMHWMLNVVTGRDGYPSAVLIRGTEKYYGSARLTKGLHITGTVNKRLISKKSGLWIEKGVAIQNRDIFRTPRIGVSYAGPVWSKKPYRFVLKTVDI